MTNLKKKFSKFAKKFFIKKPKVIIWGMKDEFLQIKDKLDQEISKGNLKILGFCCRKQDIDLLEDEAEYPIYCKEDLDKLDFDFIVIANLGSYDQIKNEALLAIESKQKKSSKFNARILSYKLFLKEDFDFIKYTNCGID